MHDYVYRCRDFLAYDIYEVGEVSVCLCACFSIIHYIWSVILVTVKF